MSKTNAMLSTAIEENRGRGMPELVRKALLICGIISSLLYVGADISGAMRWKGYSMASQTVSELIAVNAPSRPWVAPLFLIYSLLIIAFGWGVWRSAGRKNALRVAAGLIAAKEILGMSVTLFAPIHMRGIPATLSDTMHAVLTGISVLICMFPAIVLGAISFSPKFRLYSIVTMIIFLTFGILTGLSAHRMAAGLSTPWIGVAERINIYGYLLWIGVLTLMLMGKD